MAKVKLNIGEILKLKLLIKFREDTLRRRKDHSKLFTFNHDFQKEIEKEIQENKELYKKLEKMFNDY